MKKTIIAISLLGLSTGAYATKARLKAMGQSSDDNYFVEDSRSIFLNAAYANNYADSMIMEWGGSGTPYSVAGFSGGGLDTELYPKAMGGFLKKSGNYVYGAHMGNESNTGALLRAAASDSDYAAAATTNQLADADNTLDLFFAGEASSMKWGLNFLYASSKTETQGGLGVAESTADNLAVRVGVLAPSWEAYANVSLKGEAERKNTTNAAKFDGKLGVHAGGAYNMGASKIIAAYKSLSWDQRFTTVVTAAKYSQMQLGWGHKREVSSNTSVYTNVSYRMTKIEASYITNPAEMTQTIVPLNVGFETKANDWLTWRGGISANLMGTVKEKGLADHFGGTGSAFNRALTGEFGTKGTSTGTGELKFTVGNSTVVSGGASLTFGKLSLDGMLGIATATGARDATLKLDALLSRVAASYWF
jgi:hypothetical protein